MWHTFYTSDTVTLAHYFCIILDCGVADTYGYLCWIGIERLQYAYYIGDQLWQVFSGLILFSQALAPELSTCRSSWHIRWSRILPQSSNLLEKQSSVSYELLVGFFWSRPLAARFARHFSSTASTTSIAFDKCREDTKYNSKFDTITFFRNHPSGISPAGIVSAAPGVPLHQFTKRR